MARIVHLRRLVLLWAVALSPIMMAGCGGGGAPASLVGVWRSTFNDPTFGAGIVELILMDNGQFQQQTAYQAGSLITIFGTFRVFANEGLLRLDTQGGQPSEFQGTPIIYPSESHAYTLADNNTLVLQNINSGSTFTYARVA